MRPKKVYVRYYGRSTTTTRAMYEDDRGRRSLDLLDDSWYRFVRLSLEPSITTVVGSNEAGKSHLLDAIEQLINGDKLERSSPGGADGHCGTASRGAPAEEPAPEPVRLSPVGFEDEGSSTPPDVGNGEFLRLRVEPAGV